MTDADTTAERGTSIDTETTVDPETAVPGAGEDLEEDQADDPFDVPTPGGLRGLV